MRKRLTVLADGDSADDVLGNIGDQRKLVSEGTYRGFDRRALDEVLDRYKETLSAVPGRTRLSGLYIDIGEAEPVQQHPYRPPDKLVGAIKEELEDLLEKGIIEPSTSDWASPALDEITDRVGQISIISKVDMTKGFHQILVAIEDRARTAFVIPRVNFNIGVCRLALLMRLHVFSKR